MRRRPALLVLAALVAAGVGVPFAPTASAAPRVVETAIPSFDGTSISLRLTVPEGPGPYPVVLKGHGWGLNKDIAEDDLHARLVTEGYAMLTWDARGFGVSGGEANVDKPDIEGKDVSALLDWVAGQEGIALDAAGDPRAGMAGESYGGGIQLATAAFDRRLDALAPEITWSSLPRSLFPNGVIKQGWVAALTGLGAATGTIQGFTPSPGFTPQSGGLARPIYQAFVNGLATNTVTEADLAFFQASSYPVYSQGGNTVRAPTLLMQGWNDTLFPMDEAFDNYRALQAAGTPVKLVGYCGSLSSSGGGESPAIVHGECPPWYDLGAAGARQDDLVVRWFERYLKNRPVDTGAPVEYVSNEGVWHAGDTLPGADAAPLTVPVSGSVVAVPPPTGGGAAVVATPSAPGPTTLQVPLITTDRAIEVVGQPRLTVTATGMAGGETFLFAKLVDLAAGTLSANSREGHVLDTQERAFRLTLPASGSLAVDLPMVPVDYTLPAGHSLVLQVSTSSAQYSVPRGAGQIALDGTVTVPVRRAEVDRLAGLNRVATAVHVSRDRTSAPAVVIARSDEYADALAGAPLAAQLGAPILLTTPGALPPDVRLEIQRLGATEAVVLGGDFAVSPAVVDAITALGLTVTRVSGTDRFATAAAVAARITAPTEAVLVEGTNADRNRGWPDAVSASGYAALAKAPILLTSATTLPAATRDALAALDLQKVTVVGGTVAVGARVAEAAATAADAPLTRVAGTDRYATSAAVAVLARGLEGVDGTRLWLATGADWPDALAAGPAVAQRRALLVLTPPTGPAASGAVGALVDGLAPGLRRVVLVGGTVAVTPAAEAALAAATAAVAPAAS